jgi:mannose-1-phosphate guanylyltransferase
MIRQDLTTRIPETPEHGVDLSASLRHLWAIVIAPDGDGASGHYSAARRPASRRGVRARFSATAQTAIDRVARLVPRERVVVALTRRDTGWAEAAASDVRWIIQPAWRGSAAELFLAALAIATEDPDATLALFPSDHRTDDEDALLLAVTSATRAIELRPDVPVVLGVRPRRPTRGVWLEPGAEIDGLEAFGIRAVERVVRNPGVEDARALLDGETLVSTLVVVVRARTLIELGRVAAPDVLETLEPLESVFGRVEERLLRDAVYEWMPYASAADVLLHAEPLAVLRVNALAFEECPVPLLRAAS